MAIEFGVVPEGRFEIHSGTGHRRFANTILDAGWREWLHRMPQPAYSLVPQWLCFGEGDSEPSANDTGLESPQFDTQREASNTRHGGLVDAGTLSGYSEVIVDFDYPEGALAGVWQELGLSFAPQGVQPFNRALIRDENGVAAPLVVLGDEPVKVRVRLRLSLKGWGSPLELSDLNTQAVFSLDSNLADDQYGAWRQGLPMLGGEIAGARGRFETLDPDSGMAKVYFGLSPAQMLEASRVSLFGRLGKPLCHLDLDQPLIKPAGRAMYLRAFIHAMRQ